MKDSKKSPLVTVIAGAALSLAFLLAEWILLQFDVFGSGKRLYLIDSAIRAVFGIFAMLILARFYKDRLKELFTRRIPKKTFILLIPVWICFFVYLLYFFCAEEFTAAYTLSFLACCLQQITTGFYEEAAGRGVVMSGMMEKYKNSVKGRLATVLTSGLVFGGLHVMNFLFGSSFIDCLWQCFCTFVWGMFVAAIYLYTENLLLPMVIHAVWDIIIRIPNFFFNISQASALPAVIDGIATVSQLVLMPIAAVLICVYYDKLRREPETAEL